MWINSECVFTVFQFPLCTSESQKVQLIIISNWIITYREINAYSYPKYPLVIVFIFILESRMCSHSQQILLLYSYISYRRAFNLYQNYNWEMFGPTKGLDDLRDMVGGENKEEEYLKF